MLYKGYLGAYEGVWLSYGNAASAVGNVPGSLSAWLIGGPLLLWDSPYAPMVLLLAMRLVGFLLFEAVIRQVFDDRVSLLFLVLCWLNPWFQYESLLYNPSYLFLFSAMHCWSAWHMRERASFWHMIVHLLAIGMAMQLHYSWPLLAVMSTYLFWRRILKVSWSGVVVATLLIGASLIPYAMEVMSNSHITQNVDPEARQRYIGWGLVHVYPVLKSVLYWLRYGSWLFASKLVNDTQFIWLAGHEYLQMAAVWLWRVVIYGVGSATVLLAAKANWQLWRELKPRLLRSDRAPVDGESWLGLYALAAVLAVLVSAALSPIIFNYWHLMLIFPYALFPILLLLVRWSRRYPQWVGKGLLAATLFCTAVNLIAACDSTKFSYQADYKLQVQEYLQEMKLQPGQ
ncbi:3-deoxy-D-manno-octulosonic acid transferase [Aeromonas veronii]|uniref:3-deoxy-D-manno-octulosonic acid transferase n=1 Tax=Aeromonas veronii TaxID=654 RepID=UPI00191E31B6|nr:3-deoxy-D-manno-octulosonic acid transferase [Aeromonas veronii]MBL0455458.1 3-deoxy-D-manno-octulosonic acid transferase [Aeromonas veronii]HDZ8981800.1 3-deoxy-D-manno-octulosonic acid transferase [Aeromonas veronii]HEA3127243.1 3-deoxy-D-manno-octulosonic acid transferase [Aeromonas veronii]